MLRTRVIPVLLLNEVGLVKGEMFKNHKYVGDPINAVRVFNEKEVDELVILDIAARNRKAPFDYDYIQDIVSEAFMPIAYGGGISNISQIERLFKSGVEKVVLNSAANNDPELIRKASSIAGAQSIVAGIDVKKRLFGGYEVYTHNATKKTGKDPISVARAAQEMGAGEILLTSVDREGTLKGFDLELLRVVTESVTIPVVANGGANSLTDFRSAVINSNAAAVAAGRYFIYHGKHKAVLLTYPSSLELDKTFDY